MGPDNSMKIFDADGALTREFLLSQGSCCHYGCRNCPWKQVESKGQETKGPPAGTDGD